MCMQAMLAPLHQGMSQGDVIHNKASRGLLEFVMGSAFGKGSLFTFVVFVMPSQQSPPAVCNPCVAALSLLTLLVPVAQVQWWSCCYCCC